MPNVDRELSRAFDHLNRGESLQAELLLRKRLSSHPHVMDVRLTLAEIIAQRDDVTQALRLLAEAPQRGAARTQILLCSARIKWQAGDIGGARIDLEAVVALDDEHHHAWLMLDEACQALGDQRAALRARFKAFAAAKRKGRWLNRETTEPELVETVLRATDALRRGRKDALFSILADLQGSFGSEATTRLERGVRAYLGEGPRPADMHQRPKFFYMPDLPQGPYHDPFLQSWARSLTRAWHAIREEAQHLLRGEVELEDFLGLKPHEVVRELVSGEAKRPAWDAFFFYRRGKRFDHNHALAPLTSELLEAADLCRLPNQAPEILFSVLRAQSHIMPHHGTTNMRLVFHLPLIVPSACALNLVNHGEHVWREGEPVMFDDTYLHEAWNRSDEDRVVLLMDCWNPYVTQAEREGFRRIVDVLDAVEH